jgi:xanthine dehydrogenase accessory factor
MKRGTLDAILEAWAAKRPLALATEIASGAQALVDYEGSSGGLALEGGMLDTVRESLRNDRSGMVEAGGSRLFVQVFNPPLRMIVVGAVHIAQTLVPMAALTGYEVVVVDPRRAWATDARFPNTRVSTDWPDEALELLEIDRRTAVVTLTHDPKLDDPALDVALRSDCFYIGSLGSKRTHSKRLERLRERGFSEDALSRIHGPAGLALGAKSPAEIAVSVMAQLTAVLHGAKAR